MKKASPTAPADAVNRVTLEVRVFPKCILHIIVLCLDSPLTFSAEIHQLVVRRLLQRHRALLMGSIRGDIPIRAAQWRPILYDLWMHPRHVWSISSGPLLGRDGLHVGYPASYLPSDQTVCC